MECYAVVEKKEWGSSVYCYGKISRIYCKVGKIRLQIVYMEGYYLCKISQVYLYLPTITRKIAGSLPSGPMKGYHYRRRIVYFITLGSLGMIMSINQLGIPEIL